MTETPIGDRETSSTEKGIGEGRGTSSTQRILYVHNSADLYGASRSLHRLLRILDRTRFTPIVLLPERGTLEERLRAMGLRVLIDPSLAIVSRYTSKLRAVCVHLPLSAWRLSRLIRREHISLVHTNSGVVFSPALAAWLAGVPHIWHIRESFDEFRGLVWSLYAAYMRAFSVRIISVSNANAAQFPERTKAEVIHNGFVLTDFSVADDDARRAARAQFGLTEGDFVIGCVGRLKWVRKGQEFLIEAAHLLKQRNWRAKYLIVGAPYVGNEDHLHRFRALVHKLGLENEILFTGELQNTKTVYDAIDIFILPSAQPEPFGGVVIEAMASGLPVIATAIGGSLDQVEDGVTGFLVPPADAVAIADKIEELGRDPERRRRMGLAGRERVERKFNLTQMGRQIEALYDEILARKPESVPDR